MSVIMSDVVNEMRDTLKRYTSKGLGSLTLTQTQLIMVARMRTHAHTHTVLERVVNTFTLFLPNFESYFSNSVKMTWTNMLTTIQDI